MRLRLAREGAATIACAVAFLALPASPATARLGISGQPELSPRFASGVHDYVSRCIPGRALELTIAASSGVTVSIHGSRPRSGTFAESVPLRWGEDAKLVVSSKSGKRRYHVRCAAPDFPRWTFKRSREPAAQWYLIAPVATPDGNSPPSHYVTIIEGHGTPVWWKREPDIPFNSLLMPNGQLAWARWYVTPFGVLPEGAWEVHRLDGSPVRTLRTKGAPTDVHDMEPLPNGDYLLVAYRLRKGVDLRAYGGTANCSVYDGEIQQLSPSGEVEWRWSTKGHIGLGETELWPGPKRDCSEPWDYFHLNAVEPDGKGLVISGRHVNAVYRIDRATGAVEWKLGGTRRKESLTLSGDTRDAPFVGQHDARLLPDGTLTVFDNHTYVAAPRAVRFRIDAADHTARLLEQMTEPGVEWSAAEGSARWIPGGHWVVSWGATPLISERTASGRPVWRLTLKGAQSYRAQPIVRGRIDASELRKAMDRLSAG